MTQPLRSLFAAVSPMSTLLVTAGLGDHTALVTNLVTGERVAALVGHSNIIDAADFSHDGKFIATGSWDNTARIWETGTWEALDELQWQKTWVSSVSFVGNGTAVLLRSLEEKARIFNCELCPVGSDLVRVAQSRVRRQLSVGKRDGGSVHPLRRRPAIRAAPRCSLAFTKSTRFLEGYSGSRRRVQLVLGRPDQSFPRAN